MTIPQLPDENAGRARWLKITAAAWLLLVSILAVVNSVGLSRLSEQSQASAQDAHVQALNTRVAELEQQAATSKNQPKPVTQPDFEATRKALDERLAQVEQAQATDAHAGDVQALQARVGDIEARMKDFGVWRFWDELRTEHPGETFAFRHGFGLGVWRKPGGEVSDAPLLRFMFQSTPGEQEDLRRFYVMAAMFHDYRRKATGGP